MRVMTLQESYILKKVQKLLQLRDSRGFVTLVIEVLDRVFNILKWEGH